MIYGGNLWQTLKGKLKRELLPLNVFHIVMDSCLKTIKAPKNLSCQKNYRKNTKLNHETS